MGHKLLHRLIACAVFLISALQFLATAQPSVSFWDPGELSAAAYLLEVPHPPGGPLFSLVGHFFYLLPMPGNIGFRMNMVSVLASAFTVLFLYLIAVRLIDAYRGGRPKTMLDAIGTYGAAAIGALTLSFSDTFWFNGVESNYFAASTFLFSAMLYLMLLWHEKSALPGSSRYLLLIAYLVGLSGGVHLMSVLTIFTVVMVVVFRSYVSDEAFCKKTGYLFLGHVALLLAVTFVWWSGQTSKQVPSADEFHAYDHQFVLAMGGISALFIALSWKKVFNRNSFYFPVLIAGIALVIAYPGVIKILPLVIHLLSQNDSTLGVAILLIVLCGLAYLAYWSGKRDKSLLHLTSIGVLLVILGFSTYTMIVARANVRPPMNENDPKSFSALLTYLNREQYGEFPIFMRRWSPEPDRQRTFTEYSSSLDFFWRYQMHHMFDRYVLFNFVGRTSRDQDADWSMRPLYGLPLLIGLFGLYAHFRKDWRMAVSFLILFVLMGYLIAFYQNQQEPQPRERDYFYGGAYFIIALWIALGIQGLIERLGTLLQKQNLLIVGTAGVLILGALLVPFQMARSNWHTHDRSRNWLPWDYSYNMLQSCAKDAILFTQGDNDTFPLWYLQDVEGVRRDIRIVNLSLVNTSWYIREMKDRPYFAEAKPVPINLSDARIASLEAGVVPWEPQKVTIPVPPGLSEASGGPSDSALYNWDMLASQDSQAQGGGKIEFFMKNTLQFGRAKAIRVQDFMVKHIIETNRWQRPIYFAVTCSPDAKIGIDEYLRFCGLAWRLMPFKALHVDMGIDAPVLEANLFQEPQGYSLTPRYGFKFRSTADSSVFFDENEVRLLSGLRSDFRALAIYDSDMMHDIQKSGQVLDRMEQVIPWTRVPMLIEEGTDFAVLYYRLHRMDKFMALSDIVEKEFLAETADGPSRNPYVYGAILQLYELGHQYSKALDLLNKLAAMYPGDPSIRQRIDTIQAEILRTQAAPAP